MGERRDPENLEQLIALGINWVRQERERHREQSRELSDVEVKALSGHFSEEQLKATRIRDVDAIVIPQELRAFYPGTFVGVTFGDTIVCVGQPNIFLKFHESVHVAQFRFLGFEAAVERFIRACSTHLLYRENPLERQAFDLEVRFMARERFSVDDEVKKQFV